MNKQDYVVRNENMQICIEVETNALARGIISELITERKRLGITQQEIADRTGMKAPNVTRIESCKRIPTLDVLERYAGALGKKLSFSLVDVE